MHRRTQVPRKHSNPLLCFHPHNVASSLKHQHCVFQFAVRQCTVTHASETFSKPSRSFVRVRWAHLSHLPLLPNFHARNYRPCNIYERFCGIAALRTQLLQSMKAGKQTQSHNWIQETRRYSEFNAKPPPLFTTFTCNNGPQWNFSRWCSQQRISFWMSAWIC